MVEEGESALRFELPGIRDGEVEQIALSEFLGEDVVILAFYPGDFNPACSETTTGLDELDLFTMQKDISVLAVSGDSVFSHQAFAEEYGLHIPLLADVHGEVAGKYGVVSEDSQYLTRRAVFVIDHNEEIEYAWVADDLDELPDNDEIHAAVENIGDDETAQARYRVGHAHYVEGRRAFTSAMGAYEEREWMLSSRDFAQATEEFDEAREEFNTAVRFADDPEATRYFERAERKAEALWRAANWLNDSTSAFASGEGRRGEDLRQDAEGPLETARDIHEPPSPDDFPPETDPSEEQTDSGFLPEEDEQGDTSLDLDETEPGDGETGAATDEGESTTDSAAVEEVDNGDGDGKTEAGSDEQADDDIDDEELEAITAELEMQNDPPADEVPEEVQTEDEDDDADVATIDDEMDDDDLELELTDPTEGEPDGDGDDDEDDDDDDEVVDFSDDIGGGGDHGVPDSL